MPKHSTIYHGYKLWIIVQNVKKMRVLHITILFISNIIYSPSSHDAINLFNYYITITDLLIYLRIPQAPTYLIYAYCIITLHYKTFILSYHEYFNLVVMDHLTNFTTYWAAISVRRIIIHHYNLLQYSCTIKLCW